MSDVVSRLASLSPQKRALLMQQLAKREQAADITRRTRPGRIPLSFAQQRLWLLDQIDAGSASYNIGLAAWLRGPLDADRLERCLAQLVARHESLRTRFPSENGEARQEIAPSMVIPLARASAPHREAAVDLAHRDQRTPFDVARGPLARFHLVRVADDEHLFAVTFHHIVMDGWSLSVFFRELLALYRGEALPPLAIDYADFALWQREWLQGETLDKQLGYWTSRLGGELPVLELPSDRPRPAVQSYRGDVVRVSVPPPLFTQVQEFSRRENATLFMTFLAALQTVLFRYTGQQDVIVGCGIANRHRAELEPLIGCFVNTLALRTDLGGNPTFGELLARVREVTLDAYSHQDLPLERLIEELKVERSMSRSPLFQTMLFFQNQEGIDANLRGVEMKVLELDELNTGTARTDLTLFVGVEPDRLDLLLEYATDLFDAETIRAFGNHLVNVLRAAVTDAKQRIGDIDLLDANERHELLVTRNATQREVPDVPVQRLFEEQAARTPDAIALVHGNSSITYAELDTRANAIASGIEQRGALVPLQLERGIDMMATLLGILKSGNAYVPIDPSFPAERIAFMREEATTARPDGDDLAYVIFTSGSTGKPKGVQVRHAGVVNFLRSMARVPGIGADDVLCAVTTLSFDIAVLELLLPLTCGARVVIADRETAADAARLARLIETGGTTIMQATPATWRMLLDSGWRGDAKLKILCGGEALPADLAERLLACCGELWNVYGPTETTIWSSIDRVRSGDAITIGRPIDNTTMFIVDARMQLVPDGVPGELLIGGAGLARGYLARPELTAEKFVDFRGSRVYRTGDVARWRRDGRIEVLGRADHQVKIRGFRIELGEIESVLAQHASVAEVVVVAREERAGDKRLVAYIVPHDAAPSSSDLRAHLRTQLPDYMIPSAFVVLEQMPLTPNGKIDRRALPAPDAIAVETPVAPRTPEEQMLAGIWAEVLGVGSVGVADDFFALGGHSLLAAQLIARVSKAFGVEVPLRRLFDAPTVATFAEAVVAEQASTAGLGAMLDQLDGMSEDEIRALLEATQ